MKLVYIVYWKDPKKGVGPLGLIAMCSSRDEAYKFLYRTFLDTNEHNEIGICDVPMR